MEARKVIVGLLVMAVLVSGVGLVTAYDASAPYSNFVEWEVSSDTAFTVLVGGAQTKCVFQPASKTETLVQPVGQSDGTPMFTVTNAGNCNLDLKCNLTSAKPSWATILVNDAYDSGAADEFGVDTSLQTFNQTVGTGETSPMYLWSNVTDAPVGTGVDATHNRTIQIVSVAS